MKCKSCEGNDFSARHRNVGERVAYYAVPFHVFECNECGEHCWGLRLKPEEKFQWVGHIATPLVLMGLFYLVFTLFSGDAPAESPLAEETPAEVSSEAATIEDQSTSPAIDQDLVGSSEQMVATTPSQESSTSDAEDGVSGTAAYEDSTAVSAFVRQQAIRNGGKPPNITLDTPDSSPEEIAMNKKPQPAERESAETGRINSQPPPAEPPPRRKPALESLPEAKGQESYVVQSVSYSVSDDRTFELVLNTSGSSFQPKPPVMLGDHRQYIDIPGNWQAANGIANRLEVRGFPLEAVRFGFGDERLRVVFDLTEPMAELEVSQSRNQVRLLLRPTQ